MKGASSTTLSAPENKVDRQSDDEEYEEALASLEDGGQPTIDELEEINLGTQEENRSNLR